MNNTHPEQKRRAKRVPAVMQVIFWINNGPRQSSNTLNLSNRSLAIRSEYPVKIGDQVLARVDTLPPLEGTVVRVFDEGFAVRLSTISLAAVAHAQSETAATNASDGTAPHDPKTNRVFSPMFRIKAPALSWARIATSKPRGKTYERHYMTIITTDLIDVDNICRVWLKVNEIRWVAQLAHAGKRGEQTMIRILLNDWQLQMAGNNGLSISIIFNSFDEWSAHAPKEPFANHHNLFSEKLIALSA